MVKPAAAAVVAQMGEAYACLSPFSCSTSLPYGTWPLHYSLAEERVMQTPVKSHEPVDTVPATASTYNIAMFLRLRCR